MSYELKSFASIADEATIRETDKIKQITGQVPVNVVTDEAYQGKNAVALLKVQADKGFKQSIWGTFIQWQKKGYMIRKGEHGVTIFCGAFQRDLGADEEGKPQKAFAPKFARVFNIEQVEERTE